MKDNMIHIPYTEVTTPIDNSTVMLNRWWTVHKEGCISVYIGNSKQCQMSGRYRIYSPQCSTNEQIASRNATKKAVFLPIVYFCDLLAGESV